MGENSKARRRSHGGAEMLAHPFLYKMASSSPRNHYFCMWKTAMELWLLSRNTYYKHEMAGDLSLLWLRGIHRYTSRYRRIRQDFEMHKTCDSLKNKSCFQWVPSLWQPQPPDDETGYALEADTTNAIWLFNVIAHFTRGECHSHQNGLRSCHWDSRARPDMTLGARRFSSSSSSSLGTPGRSQPNRTELYRLSVRFCRKIILIYG